MREALVDLVTEVVNVDIYDIGECVQVVAPDRVNDLCACEYPAWMAHQVFQQRELFGRQLDDATGAARLVPYQVERQITHRELRGLIKATIPTAQQGIDACQEFLHSERLGEVVIGPHVEARHTVLNRSTCREHEHG